MTNKEATAQIKVNKLLGLSSRWQFCIKVSSPADIRIESDATIRSPQTAHHITSSIWKQKYKGKLMWQNFSKNRPRAIALTLILFIFITLTPWAVKDWFQVGTGLSYLKDLKKSGLTHEQSIISSTHNLRIDSAKRDGIIYSALMANSTCIPLLSYLILTIMILTTPVSQKLNKKLFALFPIFLIWGIFFTSLSQIMIGSLPNMKAFGASSAIWIGLTGIFGLIIAVAHLIRRALIKRNPDVISVALDRF